MTVTHSRQIPHLPPIDNLVWLFPSLEQTTLSSTFATTSSSKAGRWESAKAHMASGLINFGGLEALISGVVESQKEMSAEIQRLQTTITTMATKDEMSESDMNTSQALAKVERQLERIDLAHRAGNHVIEEVPEMRREMTARMTELEHRLSADVSNATLNMGGRLNAVENELRNRATVTELRKMNVEIEERVRRDEVLKLQELVNKIRDDSSERIDMISERTFIMRRDMDEKVGQLSLASETIEKAVTVRTKRLEEEAAKVTKWVFKLLHGTHLLGMLRHASSNSFCTARVSMACCISTTAVA